MSSFPETSFTLLEKIGKLAPGQDEAAWQRLWELYAPALRQFIIWKGGERNADDIVQQVLIKLVDVLRSGQYDAGKGRFHSYLATMAYNEVHMLRRKEVARHQDDHLPIDNFVGEGESFAQGVEKYHVALVDYGCKRGIVRELTRRGCRVTVWPADTTAEALLKSDPDGVMLSNGPGDPKENAACIEEIKKLLGQKPVFGICLGHQLTALAMGGDTVKLKYGHRGGNQPVRDLAAGRTYITSQNHGYAVVAGSLKGVGVESFRNANDGSCEGMEYPDKHCFTVQFHPEAASGPRDTAILFDRFVQKMEEMKNA